MMRDEIEGKKSIKKQIAIKKGSNWTQKINERTPLYLGKEKKRVYRSLITALPYTCTTPTKRSQQDASNVDMEQCCVRF